MFKRVPFVKPQVQNSYVKTDRQYPEPVSIEEMEEERSSSKLKKGNQMSTIKPMAIIGNDLAVQRFFFIRSEIWNPEQSQNPDQSAIWSTQLQKILPNEKKKILVFRKQEYVISGYTGTYFPQVIYICAPLMSGYLDENLGSTDRVAALLLTDINPILDDSSTKTFDLRYQLAEGVSWEIPPSMTALTFKIKFDDDQNYAELPLFNPMTFDFEIRRA